MEEHIQKYSERIENSKKFVQYLTARDIGWKEISILTPNQARELIETYQEKIGFEIIN